MISASILIILGASAFFISYNALRYRRPYWYAPTILGFKDRKKDTASNGFSKFIGIGSFFMGIWFFFLAGRFLLQLFVI